MAWCDHIPPTQSVLLMMVQAVASVAKYTRLLGSERPCQLLSPEWFSHTVQYSATTGIFTVLSCVYSLLPAIRAAAH